MRNSVKRIGWLSAPAGQRPRGGAGTSTAAAAAAAGQAPAAAGARAGMRGGPQVVSPQIEPDGRVTFRILAPNATSVTVGGDINGALVPDPAASRHRRGAGRVPLPRAARRGCAPGPRQRGGFRP